MRLPLAALLTACALSAALVVADGDGAGANSTMPGSMSGSEVVLPAAEGRALFADSEAGGAADPGAGGEGGADLGHAVESDPGLDAGLDAGLGDARDTGLGGELDGGLDRGLAPDVFAPDAIGPETVPEIPDLLDGGGLIPDGPDESDGWGESGASGIVFGSPADALSG